MVRLTLVLVLAAAGCATARDPSVLVDPDAGPGSGVDGPVGPDACLDSDGDSVCDATDVCAGHDDAIDSDGDQVADGCDVCAGFDDAVDADGDTVADGCDLCPMSDDRIDINMNAIPDGCDVQMQAITVKRVGTNYWRGWQSDSTASAHSSTNDNTITGLSGSNYNSYFVFTLAGFTPHTITAATLELEFENFNSGDATETISLWDVTTPASTVETTAGVAIYTDLMSGTTYGTHTLTIAGGQLGQVQTIPLAAAALTDIQAKLGTDFVIGVHLDTPPGWVRFSEQGEARVARLVVRYLPQP